VSVSSQERKHVIICMCVNGIDFSTVSVILRLDFGIVPMAKKGKKLYHNEDIGLKKYISIFIMQII
jgi:hypothetical protein